MQITFRRPRLSMWLSNGLLGGWLLLAILGVFADSTEATVICLFMAGLLGVFVLPGWWAVGRKLLLSEKGLTIQGRLSSRHIAWEKMAEPVKPGPRILDEQGKKLVSENAVWDDGDFSAVPDATSRWNVPEDLLVMIPDHERYDGFWYSLPEEVRIRLHLSVLDLDAKPHRPLRESRPSVHMLVSIAQTRLAYPSDDWLVQIATLRDANRALDEFAEKERYTTSETAIMITVGAIVSLVAGFVAGMVYWL